MAKKIILKKGKEKSLLRKHPWVFSGAIKSADVQIQPGETVDIIDSNGSVLAKGSYSPHSQIRARVLSFNLNEKIDRDFFERKIEKAVAYRKQLPQLKGTDSYRIIFSESDGLPGLIADKYGDYIVCQFLSAGAEYFKETIVEILVEKLKPKGIYERSDVSSRSKEGLKFSTGLLWGEAPPEKIEITENELKFFADVYNGHKTGFYFDQRENRAEVAKYAKGKSVLNCFSYTGGFGIYALNAGAESLVNIDSSQSALDLTLENIRLNGLPETNVENIRGDAFVELRKLIEEGRRFDLIILDPPKFIDSKKHITSGARAYKDINMLAFKLLNPGGRLVTFSCSGHMNFELFQKVVADAALDAGVNAKITAALRQGVDHPVSTNFPEAFYLKGLVVSV